MKVCPGCLRVIAEHDLDEARTCLEPIIEAARELAARACGGSMPVALERGYVSASPSWRTTVDASQGMRRRVR